MAATRWRHHSFTSLGKFCTFLTIRATRRTYSRYVGGIADLQHWKRGWKFRRGKPIAFEHPRTSWSVSSQEKRRHVTATAQIYNRHTNNYPKTGGGAGPHSNSKLTNGGGAGKIFKIQKQSYLGAGLEERSVFRKTFQNFGVWIHSHWPILGNFVTACFGSCCRSGCKLTLKRLPRYWSKMNL